MRKRSVDESERKQRLERGAADLGAAVEESVGVLLSKVADEIRKKTEQAATPIQRAQQRKGEPGIQDPRRSQTRARARIRASLERRSRSRA